MNKTTPFRKALAMVLSVAMVLGMVPITAFAESDVPNLGAGGEIIAFEALPDNVAVQTVSLGTSREELDLPSTLAATVRMEAEAEIATPSDGTESSVTDSEESARDIEETEQNDFIPSEDEEIATVGNAQKGTEATTELTIPVPVTWSAEPDYDGETAGTYIFTAEVEGFTVSASLPQITVTVGEVAVLGEITAFAHLPEDIRFQRGSTPNLPETVEGTVDGQTIQVAVTWESETDAAQPGLHAFVAKVGTGYRVASGVNTPTIAFVRTYLGRMGGLGTEANPLEITNAAQLAEIAALVNEDKLEQTVMGDTTRVSLKLMKDIDLSVYGAGSGGGRGWTPIGNFPNTFGGSFDGNGKIITGLYINDIALDYAGLFGIARAGSGIKNLGLVNVNITGHDSVGGVVGETYGTVENCYSTGNVTGNENVGGVVGYCDGRVENCYSTGTVTGDLAGGVVGGSSGTVENCYSTAGITGYQYIGGVVGYSIGTVKNCAALNPRLEAMNTNVGRIATFFPDSTLSDNVAFSDMLVNNVTVVGSATDKNGENRTANDLQIAAGFPAGFDSFPWTYAPGKLPGLFGQTAPMPPHILETFTNPFAGGDGTPGAPYQIATAEQLAWLAKLVNDGNMVYNDKNYILMNDLDLSVYGQNFNSGRGWRPIGRSNTYRFKGNFDGDGHKVTGLYINDIALDYTGLFGFVDGGTIVGLGVVNVNITGGDWTGGVAAAVEYSGAIENCYVTGTVSGDMGVGGLLGGINNSANARNCYSTATVASTSQYSGGLVGGIGNGGLLENCYSTGSVTGNDYVGGVVGYLGNGTVQNCVALNSAVTGTAPLIGRIAGAQNSSTLSGNFAFDGITVNGVTVTGGMASDKNGESKTAAGLQLSAGFPSGMTSGVWTYAPGSLSGLFGQTAEMPLHLLPTGQNPFDGGDGTSGNPYQISTAAQLAWLAERVNAGGTAYNNKHYILMNDLDLSAYGQDFNGGKGWVPIGNTSTKFSGKLDGNGKTITGLYIYDISRNYVGLFGYISTNATVQNLGVVNADITGRNVVGGVVGDLNMGTIQSCYVTGSITGNDKVGGVVGTITYGGLVKNSYAAAGVTGNNEVGGVVGGAIAGAGGYVSKVENCYATGKVRGNNIVGGVAGFVSDGSITGCVALGPSISATGNDAGRVMGRNSDSTALGNYAYSGMAAPGTPFTGMNTHDGIDGADMGSLDALTVGFWTATAGWDTAIWSIEDGRLPILKNVGGDQSGDSGLYLTPKDAENFVITGGYTYDGMAQTPTIRFGGAILTENTDYTIAITSVDGSGTSAGTNAGTVTVAITGMGNYTGTKITTFTINKKMPTASDLSFTIPTGHVYNASAQGIGMVSGPSGIGTITVKYNGGTNAPKNAGFYTVTVDIGSSTNYNSVTNLSIGSYTIGRKPLVAVSATAANKEYDGGTTAIVTGVTFSGLAGGETLESDIYYSATGTFDNANVGYGKTVTVTPVLKNTGKATNYTLATGTVTTTGDITPRFIGGTVTVDVTNGPGSDPLRIDAGDILTANTTGIVPGGATVTYQWYRNNTPISGETGNTYTVGSISVDPPDTSLSVKAIGTVNYGGDVTSGTVVVGKIPMNGGVAINGTTNLGDALTGNVEVTPATAVYSVKWLRDGAAISGATGNTYTIAEADLGKHLSVVITGTGDYSGTFSDSISIPAIIPVAPTITATAGNGQVTLNWTTRFDGGSVITAYELSTDDGASWTDIGLLNTFTVTGLTNGTSYTYKLRAINAVGTGPEAYVSATPRSGGGSGGGSSSGGSVGKAVDIVKTTNMPTTATQIITDKPNKDDNLSITVTKKMVEDGIAEAKGKWAGRESYGIALVFNNNADGTKSFTATIEATALDNLVSQNVRSLTIQCGIFRITLDEAAIKSLDTQSSGNVTITVKPFNVSGTAQTDIGTRPVFEIAFKDSTGKEITSFGAGTITRGMKYSAATWEKSGSLFVVQVTGGNKTEWIDKSSYDNGWMIWSGNSNSVYGVGYKTANDFTDTQSHWAKDNIDFVISRDLISGTTVTTFAPNTAITRGDFLMALGKLSGADVSGYKQSSFTDVTNDSAVMPYIEWAYKNGIVSGTGNNQFSPHATITREQMAVMMQNHAKVAGYTLPASRQYSTFADDIKISAYAKDAVKAIAQAGIIVGKDGSKFDPQGTATRAEAATILRRLVELVIDEGTSRSWVKNDSGSWMYFDWQGKRTTGWLTITGTDTKYYFDANGVMTSGKWVDIGGKWYYFYSDGKMARSTIIEGYAVGEDGARKEE